MAEFGRVAQAAFCSTLLLRTTPIRSQPCRNLTLASPISAKSPPSKIQHRSYSSLPRWTSPSRDPQRRIDNIADIRNRKAPPSSSYDVAFGGRKPWGGDGEEPVDFASDLDLSIADIKSGGFSGIPAPSAPRPSLRMVPRTGRTVYVKNNVDVARSFKLLAIQVAQNRLRRDSQQQKFHERGGKKRKRLESERWRKRFQKGFKATVSRVRELTAQGW
ncbi:hypothetical protein F5X98DRAFT_337619 [Xylaria grammica]|nr:hypothetical protein F5X98DRAFT_337619 [Xylaria grammica]